MKEKMKRGKCVILNLDYNQSMSQESQKHKFTYKPGVFGQEEGKQGANSRNVDVGVELFVPYSVQLKCNLRSAFIGCTNPPNPNDVSKISSEF